jgi:hypothetical protein
VDICSFAAGKPYFSQGIAEELARHRQPLRSRDGSLMAMKIAAKVH